MPSPATPSNAPNNLPNYSYRRTRKKLLSVPHATGKSTFNLFHKCRVSTVLEHGSLVRTSILGLLPKRCPPAELVPHTKLFIDMKSIFILKFRNLIS